jgi:hypothetical protein
VRCSTTNEYGAPRAEATTSKVEHPTLSNTELKPAAAFHSAFDVQCSVFDVSVSSPANQERAAL